MAKIICENIFLEKEKSLNNFILKEKDYENLKIYFTENIFNLYYYRYKLLGLFIDVTPFTLLQNMIENDILIDSEIEEFKEYTKDNIENLAGTKIFKVLGWLIIYRSAATKNGKLMGFATFFDGKNFLETVIFPDRYSCYYNLLKYYKFFKLDIEIEEKSSNSLIIQEMQPFIPDFMEKLKGGVHARNNKKTKTDS